MEENHDFNPVQPQFLSKEGALCTQHTLVGIPTEQNELEMQADAREAAAKPGVWPSMRAWRGTASTAIAAQS